MNRILITGKNSEIPRDALSRMARMACFATSIFSRNSGAVLGSVAGGSRQPCGLPKMAPSDKSPIPLGAIVADSPLPSA